MHGDPDDSYHFGPFRLSPGRRLLEKDGAPVPLGSRALDILSVLITHAPEIVTKRALLAQAWPGLAVDESNLRLQMVALRKALGDGEYVSTVKGRGYCFVEPFSRSVARSSEPSAAAQPTKTNLPHYLTAIIGREPDLAALRRGLERHRLLTIVGPGGVGKTRLANETGRLASPLFPAGVWLIDLAPLVDPDAIAGAVAGVLGIRLSGPGNAVEAIAADIGKQRMLLLFDNCEHLIEAAATLVQGLLARAAGLVVLATSQEALQVPSEQLYHLKPLAVPAAGAIEIDGFGAVDLFVERGRAGNRAFALDSGNRAGVGEICRRLDGIPLALEMAAARLNMLGVAGLCESLDDRFKVLKTTRRGDPARHGTLRAMVEWSYDLLDPVDRQVFRCLGIFPGSFSLDAAVAVASEAGADRWAVIDALGRLIDKSLVTTENLVPLRYRLLETLRLYAVEQLQASGDGHAVAEKQARHVADFGDGAQAAWRTMNDLEWIALHRPETHNVRTALDWSLAAPERQEIALALAGPSLHLLNVTSLTIESRRYCEQLIALIDDDTSPAIVGEVLFQDASSRRAAGVPLRLDYLERAVALYRELGDGPRLGRALVPLGYFHTREGRLEQALAILLEAKDLVASSDFWRVRIGITTFLGELSAYMGRLVEARDYFLQSYQMAREAHSLQEGDCVGNLGVIESQLGNLERAVEFGREAVKFARAVPGQPNLERSIVNTAAHLLALDRPGEARPLLEEAFAVAAGKGAVYAVGKFQIWAVLTGFEGRLIEAAQLIGFVDACRVRTGIRVEPSEQRLYDALTRRLEAGLSADELLARKAQGAPWSEAEAMSFIGTRLMTR